MIPRRLTSLLLTRTFANQASASALPTLPRLHSTTYSTPTKHILPDLSGMATAEILTTTTTAPAVAMRRTRHDLQCVMMRAGTSKGLFLHRRHLPADQAQWAPHLISALGSRGCDPRQTDGVGGGTSTTSKVAVVSPSQRPDADVDFTFAQVAVGKETVDYSGNCGNMVSGVGPFAAQEAMVRPQKGQDTMQVRVYNTNTDRTIVETFEIDETGEYVEDGEYTIPGVNNSGSEVKVAFVDPAGSMTGVLLPSGKTQQLLTIATPDELAAHVQDPTFQVRVSLVDAANPFVFIDATSISTLLKTVESTQDQHNLVEAIRRVGAVEMGLAKSVEEAALTRGTPKSALVYPPVFSPDAAAKDAARPDIRVQAYSMGLPHPSLQLTGAVCLAAALSVPGTVVSDLSARPVLADGGEAPITPPEARSPSDALPEREVVIEHSKGTMRVAVVTEGDAVRSCGVSRTARRLFEGKVRYYV